VRALELPVGEVEGLLQRRPLRLRGIQRSPPPFLRLCFPPRQQLVLQAPLLLQLLCQQARALLGGGGLRAC
jgi:hypothetical protein